MALANPERADMVAVLGETTGNTALRRMRHTMLSDPVGRQILEEKPRINNQSIFLQELRRYPQGTLGRAYADFMGSHQFNPDERPQVRFIEDPENAYVMQRYRECHDMFHVLLGLPPTVLGELVVKCVEATQFALPMAVLSAAVGPSRLSLAESRLLFAHYFPWAVRTARSSKYLLNVYYEKHLSERLDDLRTSLSIPPLPHLS
eukprot:CAMPEP_0196659348 /NCGR_PEP_ID=MMETSP1086-20130531/34502_1 /TAXON_ID=77921 /ORGANISM="Cyanoptyche  gloeocystis , Strain SAG4.97" /LENGTH=203 /DNA_ID=CAMNT_0041993295 /DNA_START=148 /DNA_END=759 /DNA_ORIENTATION=-